MTHFQNYSSKIFIDEPSSDIEDDVSLIDGDFKEILKLVDECKIEIESPPFSKMIFTSPYFDKKPNKTYYGDLAPEQNFFNVMTRCVVCLITKAVQQKKVDISNTEYIIDFIAQQRTSLAQMLRDPHWVTFCLKREKFGILSTPLSGPLRVELAEFFTKNFEPNFSEHGFIKHVLEIKKDGHKNACYYGRDFILHLQPERTYVPNAEQILEVIFNEPSSKVTPLSFISYNDGSATQRLIGGLEYQYTFNDYLEDLDLHIIISHADPQYFPRCYEILARLNQHLLENPNLLSKEKLKIIAASHWLLAGFTPHLRGGGAVAEWYAVILLNLFCPEFQFLSWEATEAWAFAVTTPLKEFINSYHTIIKLEKREL